MSRDDGRDSRVPGAGASGEERLARARRALAAAEPSFRRPDVGADVGTGKDAWPADTGPPGGTGSRGARAPVPIPLSPDVAALAARDARAADLSLPAYLESLVLAAARREARPGDPRGRGDAGEGRDPGDGDPQDGSGPCSPGDPPILAAVASLRALLLADIAARRGPGEAARMDALARADASR